MHLGQYQRGARAVMADRCRISDPPTAEPTVDRGALTASVAAGPVVYEGPCMVSTRQSARDAPTMAGEPLRVDELTLTLPVDVDDLALGQRVVLTDHHQPDVEWADVDWVIVRLPVATHQATRTAVLARHGAVGGLGGDGA